MLSKLNININRLNLSYIIGYTIIEVRNMMVNTETLIPMTTANQNFSQVTRVVDEKGLAVILKNNKPRYIVVDFEEYDEVAAIREARHRKIDTMGDQLISENLEAFKELAK